MRNIFVDGYNVINSWPKLNNMKNYSLETARQSLIDTLSNYSVYKGYKVFIVFDAHMVSGSLEKREKINKNVVVVFTKENETADSFIERTVNNIGRKNEVFVVTSDSLEQQVTFQRGAVRMSSIEFYHEVNNIENHIKSKIEKKNYEQRDTLEDRVGKDIMEKLDKIRKSR